MVHNSAKLTDFTVTEAPAPANFTATAGNGQNVLTWDAVPNAISYSVISASAPLASTFGAVTENILTNSYTDAGLANGSTYYYKEYAVFAGDVSSAYSTEVSATPSNILRIFVSAGTWNGDLESGYSGIGDGYGGANDSVIMMPTDLTYQGVGKECFTEATRRMLAGS